MPVFYVWSLPALIELVEADSGQHAAEVDEGLRVRRQLRDFSLVGLAAFAKLFLKRKLSFPVSRMWQRRVRRFRASVRRSSKPPFRLSPS